MNLYRFEVTLKNHEVIHVIIAAKDDEDAFRLVDVEIEKHFLKIPDIQNVSLYEKKKIRNGNGFVLSLQETA
jgi:hypothetical protein